MESLSIEELDRDSAAFDACVARSPDVDLFCSSTDWILPASKAFGLSGPAWIRRGKHGFAAFMEVVLAGGLSALQPLEAVWGLACPLVGEEVRPLALELTEELAAPGNNGRVLLLCGLVQGSPRFQALAQALAARYQLRLGPVTRRYVASLEGGLEGFLSRRSANFRDSVRKARRRAREKGVVISRVESTEAGAAAIYERLLKVERASWKGLEGVGLEASAMVEFYRPMVPRLIRRGGLRLMFATRDGEDLAFILGGIFADTYRGLQFSFRQGEESLSLGNLCQLAQISALAEEGNAVIRYDLGTDVEYKRRWAEIEHDTVTLIAFPR